MKLLRKTVSLLTASAMLAASAPCSAAVQYAPAGPDHMHGYVSEHGYGSGYDDGFHDRPRGRSPQDNDLEFDGQAYAASRYVPALRPHLVIGGLLLVALIVVVLQNHTHHAK